jgi:uncharacterized membrane protein YjjP (DUF1212 family)
LIQNGRSQQVRRLLRRLTVTMPLPLRSANDQFSHGSRASGHVAWLLLLAAAIACVSVLVLRYRLREAAVAICFIVGVTAARVLVVESLLRAFGVPTDRSGRDGASRKT